MARIINKERVKQPTQLTVALIVEAYNELAEEHNKLYKIYEDNRDASNKAQFDESITSQNEKEKSWKKK